MNATIPGIHHVTAITGDAQRNIEFYCEVLGLRLVKLTVNFDDPTSYHLYYGDAAGRPGTVITFFAWPGGSPGRIGPPQVSATSFAVPSGSLDFWRARLVAAGVEAQPSAPRFGEPVLSCADPDGLRLELIATRETSAPAASQAPSSAIPREHAISAFHGVTLAEEGYENTARLLTDVLGFRVVGSESNRFRYQAGEGEAAIVDLLCAPTRREEPWVPAWSITWRFARRTMPSRRSGGVS